VDQEDKARTLAAAAGVCGETRRVPMSPETYAALQAAQDGDLMADQEKYQSYVGSLLHIALCTRPDIALAVGALAAFRAFLEIEPLSQDFPLAGPLQIKCDNKAALTLCADVREGQRAKHIDIVHHFARERVASGELQFEYCRSEDNASDCFTKALPRQAFENCLGGLGL